MTSLKGEILPCQQWQKLPPDAAARTPRQGCVHGRANVPVPVSCVVATQVPGTTDPSKGTNVYLNGTKDSTCTGGPTLSRRKGRYARRVDTRFQNRAERSEDVGELVEIFTFDRMFMYGKDCCKGVRWKQSVQNFEAHLFSGTARRRRDILSGKFKWHKFSHFILAERGKRREIDAPHINDRQIQKTFSKEVLLPLYTPMMVWNNGASLEGKGLAFSQKELLKDLRAHYRKYGRAGYVIVTDCKGFFPNANHAYIKKEHAKLIRQSDVCRLADSITSLCGGDVGVPIGVEPSQIEMIHYPSKLDNFMKCQLGLRGAGHYMDDYYMLVPPYMDPKEVFQAFKQKAAENCIALSEHKTKIVPFGKPFRFCKAKYTISESGKVIVNGSRETIKRFRHKLKIFARKIAKGTMSYADLWAGVQSVLNYYQKTNDHGRILTIKRVFYSRFHFPCDVYDEYKKRDAMRKDMLRRYFDD